MFAFKKVIVINILHEFLQVQCLTRMYHSTALVLLSVSFADVYCHHSKKNDGYSFIYMKIV